MLKLTKSEAREVLYIETELCDGGDLFDKLIATDGKGLPEDEARRIFHQLVSAMKNVHAAGITHVDIKLDNMLISGSNIKLCDFAFAAETVSQIRGVGTPGYMAPELFDKLSKIKDLTPLDIFSSG